MEEKTNQFNSLNQTDLKGKHLFCASCEEWLIDEIYLRDDGNNYCATCSKRPNGLEGNVDSDEEEIVALRNHSMEEIRANMKYPCVHEDCSFIGVPAQLKDHQERGPHNKTECHICKKSDLFTLSHLLDDHSATFISIDEPVANIQLEVPVEDIQIYNISLRKHTFVLLVEFRDGFLDFMVGSDSIQKSLSSTNFTVCYENAEYKISASGKIHDIKTIIKGMEKKSKIFLPPSKDRIEFKVYFCNYELVQLAIDECPICCNHLTSEIYQCQNGHCVCSDCKPKINTCPSCRVALQTGKFFLKHVLSNYLFPCTHVDDGCLHLAKPNELNTHLTECLYVKVNCVECNEVHSKLHILEHLTKMHHVSNNLTMLSYNRDDNVNSTSVAYISFKQMIFRFSIMTKGAQNDMTLSCNVKILYKYKEADAQKYRYEVHVLDPQNNANVLKISNMCQIMNDETMSSTMQLELCKKYLKSNQQWSFNCKYFIFEI